MMIPTVKVITDPRHPSWCEVYIDNFNVPGLRAVKTEIIVDGAPRVYLEIVCRLETITFQPGKKAENDHAIEN